MDIYDALEFIARKVEQQAEYEGAPLTELEKKMLRFSEVEPGPLGPEESVKVSEQFDQLHDMDAYERKIQDLIRRAYERDKEVHGHSEWNQANSALLGHDYYLLVMVGQTLKNGTGPQKTSLRDNLLYLAIALAIASIVALVSFWRS